jgi:hypothetical protein
MKLKIIKTNEEYNQVLDWVATCPNFLEDTGTQILSALCALV